MVLEIADFIQKSAIFEPKNQILSQKSVRISEFYATFQLSGQPTSDFFNKNTIFNQSSVQKHDFQPKSSTIHQFYHPKAWDFFIHGKNLVNFFRRCIFSSQKLSQKSNFRIKNIQVITFSAILAARESKSCIKIELSKKFGWKSATTKCRHHLKSRRI